MGVRLTLPDWSSLAAQADDTVPLLETALLIARDEYPNLDADLYDTLAQSHAEHPRPEIEAIDAWPLKMAAINRHLFDELGYTGNHDEYYDPRNSYLNEVFERRLGNPISLAMVQIEVARRLGVPLDGVSFPGHFLVRLPVDDGILVLDPYNKGRPVSAEELRERASPHLGGQTPDDQQLLQILAPATHRMILVRMLRNLKGLYAQSEDWERVARTADRLLKLAPDTGEALRDRGLAYRQLGYAKGARDDLARYLQLLPEADDVEAIRVALIELGSERSRIN